MRSHVEGQNMLVKKPSSKRRALSTKNILDDTMYRSQLIREQHISQHVQTLKTKPEYLGAVVFVAKPKEQDAEPSKI